jgi:hypothetical protein
MRNLRLSKKLFKSVRVLKFDPVGKSRPVPEFIDPPFRENKPKTLVFSH